jgi:hypothetical protein
MKKTLILAATIAAMSTPSLALNDDVVHGIATIYVYDTKR